MDIRDVIEEKYTNYLNCKTDDLDLTIEEAKFILANDEKIHFVDDLLVEAYKVVLSELEKKDKIIDEMAGWIFDKDYTENSLLIHRDDYYSNCIKQVKQYFTKKVEEKTEEYE